VGSQAGDDLLVANVDDPWSARLAVAAPARVVGVSLDPGREGAWRPSGPIGAPGTTLRTPEGDEVAVVERLPQRLPHQLLDALAAAAAAVELGVDLGTVRAQLEAFTGLPHRMTFVGEWNERAFYDDSRAINPHATLAALAGLDSVVLITPWC
jgi:UDP-N-acetylmuramoylalanine--D-glutamate ligase